METLQFGEPPAEILAEIEAGLDDIYQPTAHTELGEAVELRGEQAHAAVLRYLMRHCSETGWDGRKHQPDHIKRGVVSPISQEVGLDKTVVKEALRRYAAEEVIDVDVEPKGTAVMVVEVRKTSLTEQAWHEYAAARPSDAEAVERFLVRHKRQTIMFVRMEINHERQLLGYEPEVFQDLSGLEDLDMLDDYLAELQIAQQDLLKQLGVVFYDEKFKKN